MNEKEKKEFITEEELYEFDDLVEVLGEDFKQKYPETITYIPTMEELECINFEKYFKTYAPFVLYTIREMDTVISNELDIFTEDEIARAKEVRKYLSAIQFKYTKFEE